MSKFINIKRALGEDSNPILTATLSELAKIENGKYSDAVNKVGREEYFQDGEIYTLKGFSVESGEFDQENGTPNKKFDYVIMVLSPKNGGEEKTYSVKALNKLKITWENGVSKILQKPENAILLADIDKHVNKDIKVVKTPYFTRFSNGRIDSAQDVAFVPA